MASSTPWITDSKHDPIWHYSEFGRWVVENRELIKEKMVDENNIREQGKRGKGFLKPQIDEIIVLNARRGDGLMSEGKDYYYWFNYTDSPRGKQYLIDDIQLDEFLSVGDLESKDYTKLRRRVQTPNPTWAKGDFGEIFRNDWDFYRIKFKDIVKKTSLINWNEIPWSDVK